VKAAIKEKRYLLFSRQAFDKYGATYICNLLGRTVLFTADPQNFKAVLSSQFAEFDAGPQRAKAFKQLFGTESAFTTDGNRWKHARSVLRPGLTQTQAIDFNALEVWITADYSDSFICQLLTVLISRYTGVDCSTLSRKMARQRIFKTCSSAS
jgi:cytochrome P450